MSRQQKRTASRTNRRVAKTQVPKLLKVMAFQAIALERQALAPQLERAVNRARQTLELYGRATSRQPSEKERGYLERLVRRGWDLINAPIKATGGTVDVSTTAPEEG